MSLEEPAGQGRAGRSTMPPMSDAPTLLRTGPPVLTPSQLNTEAQVVLEENFGRVRVEGELSNLARPASGHWYFSLKDRRAQVRCAMFRNRNSRVKFRPENGMQVLLTGRVSLYVGRGEFQLIVDAIEPAGEGALRLAFDQLRLRLAAEGLFDDDRKRPLPESPTRIAVITSPSGAAIRDILQVLARRWPLAQVTLIPSAVQGEAATGELVAAFRRLTRWCETEPDSAPQLVIAGRGGGSLEDLWCFNEEAVARAIADSPVPVIAAVGHETDYTIADFVADLRAPTPSAAAELATPDAAEWRQTFAAVSRELAGVLRRRLEGDSQRVDHLRRRLRHPGVLMDERTQRLDELDLRLRRRLEATLGQQRRDLERLRRRLAVASPAARLERDRRQLAALENRLRRQGPAATLPRWRQQMQALRERLVRAQERQLAARGDQLRRQVRTLRAFDPLAVVDRGYALLTRPPAPGEGAGMPIRDPASVAAGERLHARLAAGVLEVEAIGPVTAADPLGDRLQTDSAARSGPDADS